MAQKLYPFSIQRHAHDIELLKNAAYNRDDDETYQKALNMLLLLDSTTRDGRISWLSGEQYAEAREMVAWAVTYRDACNHR